jgi:hypothetical protein
MVQQISLTPLTEKGLYVIASQYPLPYKKADTLMRHKNGTFTKNM